MIKSIPFRHNLYVQSNFMKVMNKPEKLFNISSFILWYFFLHFKQKQLADVSILKKNAKE